MSAESLGGASAKDYRKKGGLGQEDCFGGSFFLSSQKKNLITGAEATSSDPEGKVKRIAGDLALTSLNQCQHLPTSGLFIVMEK